MNFNELLNQFISNDTDTNTNDNFCLISQEPLDSNCIKLDCSHKFNYNPIFNEIKRQKHHQSFREVQKLKKWQIKCPYCRSIQNSLLPPKDGFPKVIWVNSPLKYVQMPFKCCYTFSSGKRKGLPCNKPGLNKYCNAHQKIIEKRGKKNILLKHRKNHKNYFCTAVTKKGTRCKRKSLSTLTPFCCQHAKLNCNNNPPQNSIINNNIVTI